ncbi:MAG TPA: MBL fold metallo-hydrolase [Solirubrobacteraceae bacterium]|nr:MBL fold metallo-hydrolase [Solirubrobacteraceae bacterium]
MITLEPVDRIELTILVDNLTDPLLVDQEHVARVNWPKALLGAIPRAGSRTSPEQGVPDALIENRQPSFVLDGCALVTGEVDRTIEFETGFQGHEARRGGEWHPDPLILDDQALVVRVRDEGLLVLSGCGHAGIVNTVRYAQKLTGEQRIAAIVGGFHLSGPMFERIIDPTVEALGRLAPSLLVPAHCTGWKAVHRLAGHFPDAFVQCAVGTTIEL